MNEKELEICNDILKRVKDNKSQNEYLLTIYKWDINKYNKSILKNKEYNPLDYLDRRRNLIEIPNYCDKTWESINIKIMREYLIGNIIN